jgi:dienelactone hydrolase
MSNRELAALVGNAGRTTREIAIAEDGTRVPLILFRPTGASARRGPALLWVHAGWNGKDDVSPRWKQEIQYLLQLGYTVAGVNYRGSTGYGNAWTAAGLLPDGKPDLDRMAVDARAAARYLRERDYVDPSRLYVMSVSWGGRVAARLVASQPGWFRGAVQWSASSNVWQDAGAGAAAGSFPPLLVVAGTLDRMADQEHQLALRPAAAYRRIEWFWVEDGHSMVLEQSRTVALQRVADFLRATQAP